MYYEGLGSQRLFFRKLTYKDINSWMEFYKDNPNLKYLGIDLNRDCDEMAKAWIDTQIERYEKNTFGQLGIIFKETKELVGTGGFKISEYCQEGTVEIAVAIKPTHWRKGIGKEANITLINAVFKNSLAHTIIGRRHIDNYPSQKFNYDFAFEDISILKDNKRLVVKFQLTKARWEENNDFYNHSPF